MGTQIMNLQSVSALREGAERNLWPFRRLPSRSIALILLLVLIGAMGVGLAAVPVRAEAAELLDVPKVVKETQDAVVIIRGLDKAGKPQKLGTGFFVLPDGLLVTNYHVIKGAANLLVNLNNGAMFFVDKVVFADPEKDFAFLQVSGRNLPVLKLGDSDRVQVGQGVVAIGNPLGLESSVSTGIVSGVRRLDDRVLIQTTAPISHGNSGGPLLSADGQVIGVTTMSVAEGQNLNFAIAINQVKDALTPPAHGEANLSDAAKSQLSYLKGVLSENKNDYAAAERYFLDAVRLTPQNFDAWLELGGVYYDTGQTDKEIEAFKTAAQRRPLSADAHYYLGTAYEEKGQFDAALLEYRKAVSLKPEYLDALFDLALLELIQGHRNASLALYRRLKPLNLGMSQKLFRILELTADKGGR
jgi:tetratricopeptide (TPR) repeat protein